MRIFGPVPSRRLGQSLGVNNVPPKHCSYSCVYCQLGRTDKMQMARSTFFEPEELWREAEPKIAQLKTLGQTIDYVTFVGDGEPTLDGNLGKTIELFRRSGRKIAVISNASLIWRDDVKDDLLLADWVSLKVDSVDINKWRTVDRPYGYLDLRDILHGIIDFARIFKGTLVTETMLVEGLNDDEKCLCQTAAYLSKIRPAKAYILVPTRPPAEKEIRRPKDDSLRAAVRIFENQSKAPVECISGDEGVNFCLTEDPVADILSITAVHPVREDVIAVLLKRRQSGPEVVDKLLGEGLVKRLTHEGKSYLVRKW
ncbi:radical SAM protein [Acididesulfobacillus acetoxydans]|nr:radical SAM protein [Acididesulfobacillus acetoxydans]